MKNLNRALLFNASCLALVVTALSFGTRGGFIDPWMKEFALSGAQVGWIVGTAFWGFTVAMVIFGPLVDIMGIGRVIAVAFACHLIGLTMTIFANGFWTLFFSTMFIGIANGSVEAACNPLITAIYPNDKTAKLNRFHMWFPTGIVVGGLLVYFLNKLGIGWRIQTAFMLVPTLVYGFMFLGQKFPQTERVTTGATYKDMLKACVSPCSCLWHSACCLLQQLNWEPTSGSLPCWKVWRLPEYCFWSGFLPLWLWPGLLLVR
jgi:MFS family permease